MEIKEILDRLQALRLELHTEDCWNNPNALSDKMARLATGNAFLAEHIAPLHKQATEKEVLAFRAARQAGATAKDAELTGKFQALENRQNYENAKLVHKATGDLVNTIQSRLKVLNEQARGNQ